MTSSDPITDDDLSASLDGEGPADLEARLAQDPRARARLAELAAGRDALARAEVAPLDPDEVDRLIATALEAPVVPVARRQPPGWLVAAVVLVLVAIGLTLVWTGRDDGGDEVATRFEPVGERIAEDGAGDAGGTSLDDADAMESADEPSMAPETAGTDGAPTTVAPAPGDVVALGSFATPVELREALKATFAPGPLPADVEAPTIEQLDRCAEQVRIVFSFDDGPSTTGWAVVDGDIATVYEFATEFEGRPTTFVAAVTADACAEVAFFYRG